MVFSKEINLIQPLIQIPRLSTESSKGTLSIFISPFPFLTTNTISNDYPTSNEINKFIKYINPSDSITMLGSMDFVLGSIDSIGSASTTTASPSI